MNPSLEEWLMSKLPGPGPMEEPEKTEEIETHVKEEVEEESVPVEDDMLTSRSLVLKSNPVLKISPDFPRIESRIFIKKDLYYESNGKYLSYIIYKFEYIRIYLNHK